MSIYAVSGDTQEQVASNQGWSQFGEWADSLDVEKYGAVVALWEHAIYEPADELKVQLKAAQAETAPSEDVAGVIEALLAMDTSEGFVLITNGMQPANETKAADTLEEPEPLDDPHGMRYSGAEKKARDTLDTETAVALAFGLATPEKRALMGAKTKKE